tara:strand:- start:497 stop:1021 length:525 start_codon:yes stop_codon:yes gene_type:complete
MSYYTKNGDYIRNPSAYAKTGAPMYKTKYDNSQNINKKHDIYKLNLENGKKYIGKTTDIDKRMNQHFNGNGSKVTQKFKPIEGKVIDSCYGYFSSKVEQKHTNKNIDKYGYNNVRGGYYTNSKTLKKNNYENESSDESSDEYDNKNNNCYRCGREGHYADECYASKHTKGYWLD